MQMMIRTAFAAVVLAAVSLAHAASGWVGKGEAGFVMARGNTDTDAANAKLEIARKLDRWKHTFGLAGLYARSGEMTTAQRWDTRWQTDYDFTARLFGFGAARYEKDRFSGFDYQASLAAGVGYRLIDEDATKLTAQVGAGYRGLREELLIKDPLGRVVDRLKGDSSGDVILNAGMKFEHAFNDATKLLDSLLVESGSDNTQVVNQLALQVRMTDVLALALGYEIRNNSNPPAGLEKTDKLTTVNLVYEIR
ncbi:MAG: DUF481 domain-containing protein [Gammaproteobacteria bacterium]|nr:DUF481 domain-containing protein [Gammaproteobacteria bacterium]